MKAGALDGANLVLAIPTASGKTFVAELCMLKHFLEGRGKTLYLVPLRALASEKFEEFKKYEPLGVRVAISTGDYDSSDPWLERYDVIVATNEKADSLLRHRAHWIDQVSLIVADEVHLINESTRGPTLEAVLARLKQVNPKAQFLALSATIKNSEEIAEWLNAKLVVSDWRPVPLREGVFLHGKIFFKDGEVAEVKVKHADAAVALTVDVIRGGGQILIFTNSRQSAVAIAKRLQEHVAPLLKRTERAELMRVAQELLSAGERTRISELLAKLISSGVAFHHAGLSSEQRRIVETAFRSFLLKAVVATPTLAAGVNLPARRVVIYNYHRYEPGRGQQMISVLEEKQMAGRAGRPRYDDFGEAILIARTEDEMEMLFEYYILAEPERIWSKLGTEPALRSHILACVASGFAHSEEGVMEFIKNTFYGHQFGEYSVRGTVARVLEFLEREKMLKLEDHMLQATAFGRRVSELYIDPLSAVILRDGLLKASKNSIPIGLLHLICSTPDMPKLYLRRKDWEPLESFLNTHRQEFINLPPDEFEDPEAYEFFLMELKTTLLIYDWIEEVSEDTIIEKYDVGSGDIRAFIETAKWLIYSAHELAKLFGRNDLLASIRRLLSRVEHGVKEELLPLVSLKGVGRVRARALYQAGYRTLEDLRAASLAELVKVPTVGVETAKLIKQQLGEKVSEKELQEVPPPKRRGQQILEDYLPKE